MPVSRALPTCFPFTARLAWLSASCVLVLILLGTLITTYRVGMVDPIWPTEPWFLLGIEWNQSAGFFIEHIHRVAGYFAGLFILATAIAAWASRGRGARLIPLLMVIGVSLGIALAMASVNRELAKSDPLGAVNKALLLTGMLLALASAMGLITLAIWDALLQIPGSHMRLAASLGYVGVVTQGLLGGLRVYLNALVGPELATIHGAIGQMVLALVTLTAILAWPVRRSEQLTASLAQSRRLLTTLVVLCLLQLIWAVVVRHQGATWAQRLHVLFAILIAGWVGALSVSAAKTNGLKFWSRGLGVLLLLQVILGVEAWLGKFGSGQAFYPEARSMAEAFLRTSHSLLGAVFLSWVVAAWARAGQLKGSITQGSFLANSPFAKTPFAMLRSQP